MSATACSSTGVGGLLSKKSMNVSFSRNLGEPKFDFITDLWYLGMLDLNIPGSSAYADRTGGGRGNEPVWDFFQLFDYIKRLMS